ncbi:hypothetical protein [Nitrosomonas marina]|nr:hypothetical protein [Nitrosomonas marina]
MSPSPASDKTAIRFDGVVRLERIIVPVNTPSQPGDATGVRSEPPCQDGTVLQYTSCSQSYVVALENVTRMCTVFFMCQPLVQK